jgi:predicted DNA-binding transcriptional regulator YafY
LNCGEEKIGDGDDDDKLVVLEFDKEMSNGHCLETSDIRCFRLNRDKQYTPTQDKQQALCQNQKRRQERRLAMNTIPNKRQAMHVVSIVITLYLTQQSTTTVIVVGVYVTSGLISCGVGPNWS